MIAQGSYTGSMERIGPRKPIRWFIRDWRKKRKLTLQQVADRLEATVSMISDLETGKRRMNDDWMAAFAEALQCDPGDLLRDPDTPTQADLLSMGTPDELRAAMRLVQMAKTGTTG